MKKLGKIKLNPEKILTHDELVNFKGGSGGESCGPATGDLCIDCINSAECACRISCGYDDWCYSDCVWSQTMQCASMYC